ncbi:MAG: HAMP domain-containing histidine kinase, partial [bacterium]|nr:HAMP domain-containing histidine kinase [bacterium]
KEFWKRFRGIAIGLVTFAVVLFGASNIAAKLILRPLAILNRQARAISETHLKYHVPRTKANDEFNALAITLNKVFTRLEHAFQRRKRLIAHAAHELRTPLTIMHLSLHNATTNITQCDKTMLLELLEQVLRMKRLVKMLLELSILETSAKIQPVRVDLHKLLAALADDYYLIAQSTEVALYTELSEPLAVSGDMDRLYLAFSNLLDNAVKYSYPGGEIHLTTQRTDAYVTVVISNTGPPLSEDEAAKVFEPFYRGNNPQARKPEGGGLGLPMVKRIIELHNGRITLQSTPEGYIEVRVLLPEA